MGNTHPVIHIDKRKKKRERIIKREGDKIKRSVDNSDDKKLRVRGQEVKEVEDINGWYTLSSWI